MNTWCVSGEVVKFGFKGGDKYPKLWIQVLASGPRDSGIQDNKIFMNFDMDPNTSSKRGKVSAYVKSKLESDSRFVFISDLLIANIPSSKKTPSGEWVKEEMIGVKGRIENICLSTNRFDDINTGFVSGPVVKYYLDVENKLEKFIIEERYRNPSTNEWKSRSIPILNKLEDVNSTVDLTGKIVFVLPTLCGTTAAGESKTFGWARKLIVT